MKDNIEGLNFQPQVSESYRNGTGIYGKLLIIGESQYIDYEDEDENIDEELNNVINDVSIETPPNEFTSGVIKGYIDKKWDISFYRNLGRLFNKKDSYKVWKNVAFSNVIQVGLNSSISQPTPEQIQTIAPVFWILLENLKPEKILVCSSRMWWRELWWDTIDEDLRSTKLPTLLDVNGKHSTVWEYKYKTGVCKAIGINHPSRGGSSDDWRPLVTEFLSL